MAKSSRVVDVVSQLAEPVAAELGLELVDVVYEKEGSRWLLRVFIDKPGGVTIADCEMMSRRLDPLLDEADPIPHEYALEVSSPGVERPLKRPADFQRFAGQEVALRLFAPVEGRRNWQGRLLGLDDAGNVRLATEAGEKAFPFTGISRAHLVFRFPD
ncbi:MAG: ribosome maturation factor RimP [Limnochordales bacterium]|nr:ribosome maturation factor RimP [Limnochordales bacterium]